MFLLQQILRCGPGRQREAVKRLNWIHSQMAAHPGSAGMLVARYLGNPVDVLILRQWKTREAYEDFMQSPAGQFPQSKPAGIYDSLDIGHNWEEVIHTDGNAPSGDFIWRGQYRIPAERWEEFLKLRRDDDKLAQWYQLAEHPGSSFGALVYAQTFRNLDNPEEALVITRLQDRQAMEDIVASPSRNAIEAAISLGDLHPGTARAPRGALLSDCFEVVDEVASS
jgi:quinol monooxygenase YgiN